MSDSKQTFKISVDDFDISLLPENARNPNTPAFRDAVSRILKKEFEKLGGSATISVGPKVIEVEWDSSSTEKDPLDEAIELLSKGDYKRGIMILRLLMSKRKDDFNVIYNLGMALSDQSNLSEAINLLKRATQISPGFVNAQVALGVALKRHNLEEEAINSLTKAVNYEPDNPYAHRNLGACLMDGGDKINGLKHLKRATELAPNDQAAWLGLAQALQNSGDITEADEAYIKTIDINEYSDIAEIAKTARTRIAQKTFQERGGDEGRMDAVMYCLEAIERFESMPPEKVKQISFEIGMLGMKGIDTNDPTQKYTLRSLPGKFSGLQLMSMMYVGFKNIDPNMDIGFDLSREYKHALKLHGKKG